MIRPELGTAQPKLVPLQKHKIKIYMTPSPIFMKYKQAWVAQHSYLMGTASLALSTITHDI